MTSNDGMVSVTADRLPGLTSDGAPRNAVDVRVSAGINAQLKDTLALTRLERETAATLPKLNGDHLRRAQDATVFTETWADLSKWTVAAVNAVGSGRMRGDAGVQRPIHVAAWKSWWG